MRKDFKKVLVDTTRINKGRCRGRNADVLALRRERIVLYDDGDVVEEPVRGVRGYRMKGWDRKEFGENLAPLWRYLEKQVGRPWDKVFSEINEACPNTGRVNAHIYEHLFQFVEKNVILLDGKPHRTKFVGGLAPLTCPGGTQVGRSFWIHPENGILMRSKVVPRKRYPGGFGWRNRKKSEKTEPEIRVERDGIEFVVEPLMIDSMTDAERVAASNRALPYDKYLVNKGFDVDKDTLSRIRARFGYWIKLRQVKT